MHGSYENHQGGLLVGNWDQLKRLNEKRATTTLYTAAASIYKKDSVILADGIDKLFYCYDKIVHSKWYD